MNNELSKKDIVTLSKNPNAVNKSVTAQKVSALYNSEKISGQALDLAEAIFRILVKDVEIKVRESLAESLKNCRNLPSDIVKDLINDVDSVSMPFIKYYADLSQEDIINIIDSQNIDKQKAVAMRSNLSENISHYIAETCSEDVIGVLVSNESAKIRENTYDVIIDRFADSEQIKKNMVYRSELPVSIIEKIVHSLSDELLRHLVLTHNLPNDIACDIVEQVKEKTTLKISEEYSSDKKIEELIHELYTSNRLTASLVVRAICMGDLKFFEYALVYLSNTPIMEVRKILFSNSMDFMIRNLLRKAYIPKSMFPAVFSALKVIKDIRFDYKKNDSKSFAHKVIERILSYGSAGEDLSEDDVKYLISKIC